MNRIMTVILILLMGFVIFAFLYDIDKAGNKEVSQKMVVNDALLFEVNEKRPRFELFASQLIRYTESENVTLKDVRFSQETREGVLTITSDQGYFDRAAKAIKLVGNVKALRDKNLTVEAIICQYLISTKNFKSNRWMTIEDGGIIMFGEAGEYFVDSKRGWLGRVQAPGVHAGIIVKRFKTRGLK